MSEQSIHNLCKPVSARVTPKRCTAWVWTGRDDDKEGQANGEMLKRIRSRLQKRRPKGHEETKQ